MTERKPPGVSFEGWVDKQIREASERGDFSELPGFGKPLPTGGEFYDENWWIKDKLRRENLSYLPPSLMLRREAEDARTAALKARSERQLRQIITEINEKISEAVRRPPEGPPLNLVPFDVDEVLREWRANR